MTLVQIETKTKPAYLSAIEDHGKFFLFRLEGALDMHALELDRDKMTMVSHSLDLTGKSILCDFGQVTHCDTATLAALVTRLADFRKRGGNKMIFFNVREEMRNLFEIAHLTDLFLICGSQEEAEAAVN